jgi:hypothetical protein
MNRGDLLISLDCWTPDRIDHGDCDDPVDHADRPRGPPAPPLQVVLTALAAMFRLSFVGTWKKSVWKLTEGWIT